MRDVPKIELFARRTSPGWDVWGNEVESDVVQEQPIPLAAPAVSRIEENLAD